MATTKREQTAKRSPQGAARAREKRTIANLPAEARSHLGKQAARGSRAHALEDRNRGQLYDLARQLGVPGRSKMGKWELIEAIRAAR